MAIVVCLAVALLAPPALAQTFTDLGTPGNLIAGFSQATAINGGGQVVGNTFSASSTPSYPSYAFLYSDGVLTDLTALLCIASGCTYYEYLLSGINVRGQVVGSASTNEYDPAYYAFLYSTGVWTGLGTLPGGTGSGAAAINDSGQIAGSSTTASGDYHAFLYSNGVMTDLGTLPGFSGSYATAINAIGQVVGWSVTASGATAHAFLYSDGVITDLGTLPGGSNSQATGINASAQVVGFADTAGGAFHAFLYSNGVMTDLGTLPGHAQSQANGINASGNVVGYSYAEGSAAEHAFLYSGGAMIDLNSLVPASSGLDLQVASAINDSGQIVGSCSGETIGILYHAFLLDLTTLSPSSATAGAPAFTLTITNIGTSFVPGATVSWNGTVLAASYISATQMKASVPASLIATPGTAKVTVTTNEGALAGGMLTIRPPRGFALPREPMQPPNREPRADQ